jgi:hypothetical protein
MVTSTPSTPSEFIDSLPPDRQSMIRTIHETVSGAAPELDTWVWQGKMWGGTDQTILGYGHYDYVNTSGEEIRWFQIGLANQKAYVSLYVNAVKDGKYLGQVYAERLGKVKLGSASISIRKLGDVDLAVLAEMVREAVATPTP